MADWAALPTDILVLIAERVEYFEDFFKFYTVCKSWHSVTLILGTFRTLPSRFPWIMLTDKAERLFPVVTQETDIGKMLVEQVRKNEQIQGMHNRQFFNLAASKVYEFELPEATRKKCLGVGYGLLLTLDYDLQINILNPFTRQQIGLPNMLSFKAQYNYNENVRPQQAIHIFIRKVAMSSNPYKPSSNRDNCCIIMAIYGEYQALAFARPGDKVWTDVSLSERAFFLDVLYYNGKFYAVNHNGVIYVCDFNDANEAKATPIAFFPDDAYVSVVGYHKYLVESSGDLLLVVRLRKREYYDDKKVIGQPYNYTVGFFIFKLEPYKYTFGFSSIFKMGRGHNYPYKLTKVNNFNLGNNALFIGDNASVSVPCSRCAKANSIYFSDDEVVANHWQPYEGSYDTGFYDVKSRKVTLHSYASKFISFLTPPMWIIS